MNYCASVLLYEFKILSSNFSLALLHNSSAISWHHPIITYCCNFVDDSHSCWSRHQPRWQWWWLTTTTVTVCEWVFCIVPRKSESNEGYTAPHCAEYCSRTPTTSRARTKLVQFIQGLLGHQASYLQSGQRTAPSGWVAKHDRVEVPPVEGYWASKGRVCISSTTGTGRDMVDSFAVFSTYKRIGHMGSVQASL